MAQREGSVTEYKGTTADGINVEMTINYEARTIRLMCQRGDESGMQIVVSMESALVVLPTQFWMAIKRKLVAARYKMARGEPL